VAAGDVQDPERFSIAVTARVVMRSVVNAIRATCIASSRSDLPPRRPCRAGDAGCVQYRFAGGQHDTGNAYPMRARPIEDLLSARSTSMLVGPAQQHGRALVLDGHGQLGHPAAYL
jgi:hypothetical protein